MNTMTDLTLRAEMTTLLSYYQLFCVSKQDKGLTTKRSKGGFFKKMYYN